LGLLLAAFVQELPSRDGNDEAPCDPEHRYRNAIEFEDQCAEQQRAQQNEKRVPGNALGRRRRVSGEAPRVKPKKTSADPGGLTTGKIAASTRRKVLRAEFMRGTATGAAIDNFQTSCFLRGSVPGRSTSSWLMKISTASTAT
jgi:hypothetical protein